MEYDPINYLPLPKIEISEIPIYINEGCREKSVVVRIDESILKDLVFQLDGENMAVSEMPKSGSVNSFCLLFPEEKRHHELTIKSSDEKGIPVSYEVPVHYFKEGDTLDFYHSSSFDLQRETFLYPLECWPNYKGGMIKGPMDYGISYNYIRNDKVVGDTLHRTVALKNVKFSSLDSDEEFLIEPPISRTFSVKNYAGLDPSSSVFSSTHKTVPGKELGINTEFIAGLGFAAQESGFPTYFMMGFVQGNQYKLRANDCFQYDTLETIPLKMPGSFQIVLTKCDWGKE